MDRKVRRQTCSKDSPALSVQRLSARLYRPKMIKRDASRVTCLAALQTNVIGLIITQKNDTHERLGTKLSEVSSKGKLMSNK